MMHHVVTTNPPHPSFASLSKIQLQNQKLDWATECQTPLNSNPNEEPHPTDSATSPSPGSEDGPEQPHTPPATNAPRGGHVPSQKPSFSPPILLSNGTIELNRLGWRFNEDRALANDLLKMQIRDKIPESEDASQTPVAHSRASSGDTSSSEASSAAQLQINTAVGSSLASKPYTAAPGPRPRSFQEGAGMSDADRKRLQILSPVKVQGIEPGQGPKTSPPREPRDPVAPGQRFSVPELQNVAPGGQPPRYPTLQDQPQPAPTYPSINHVQQGHRPPPISVAQGVDIRAPRPDEEFFQPQQQQAQRIPGAAHFPQQSRVMPEGGPQFRDHRPSPHYPLPQPILAPPSAGYATYSGQHLPLGPPTPQMYELALPGSPFRPAHQPMSSDPANAGLRDAQLALMSAAAHPHHFASSTPPHAMMYPSMQFFPGVQGAYPRMAQPPAQFPPTPSTAGTFPAGGGPATPASGGSQASGGGPGGPSANNRKLGLYKTELCRSWEEKGSCRYGPKCQFAHGEEEIRKVARHPKYKTEICRTFWVSGSCPYGKRCCFIHTELPASTGGPGVPPSSSPPADGSSAPNNTNQTTTRARSQSTNSDPTDTPVSILTRIAAQRNVDAQQQQTPTPTEGSATPTFPLPQQRPGALRVDTTALDPQRSMKSAYPYTTNPHSLPKNGEHTQLISPGPVTAGPDLGRSAARFEVVGYNERYKQQQAQTPSTVQPTPINTQPASNSLRHSFNGTETLNLQTQLALSSGHSSPFDNANGSNVPGSKAGAPPVPAPAPSSAHSRSESASSTAGWGNAGGFPRGLGGSSPWSSDLSVGANRPGTNNSGSGNNSNNWS